MLLYVCLVLGAWKGVMGKHVVCNEPNSQVCNTVRDLSFPKTEADIDQMCPLLIEHLDCLQDYSDKCGSNGDLQLFPGMRDVVEDGCRKDSSLHLRIVQSIGCFHEVVRYDIEACNNYTKGKSAAARKYILNLEAKPGHDEDNYDHELWMPFRCLMQSLEIVCLASKSSERCGSDAGDVLLEVVGRAGFSRRFCASSGEDSLAKLLTLLELKSEEEASLNRLIRGE
ncbi:hypothetical protein AVEN_222503-1 [Araneus ventricosus]|uniref:Secreted protein n=1 Tax=Araneus ventricosus TaxID=182803 RepID=A0A4Y2TFY6_ARAVE|nr:hypothetical protein AVEN_64973-1 [Araneus ventricosus]GBN99528.1 hypothetical protein AVEN_222503-1 [Araneus ventricosus]